MGHPQNLYSRRVGICEVRRSFNPSILLPNLSLRLDGFPALPYSLEDALAIFVHLQFGNAAFAGMNADGDTLTIRLLS